MIFSKDRILATHVGSLPRNEVLTELLIRQESGETIDLKQLAAEKDKAVADIVARQKAAGIDIGNDGEQQRVGFQTYVPQRMSGFAGESKRPMGRDLVEFPELIEVQKRRFPRRGKGQNAPEAQAELKYLDLGPVKEDIARFKKAAQGQFAETFMTAPSPGIIATTMLNAYYDSYGSYLAAIAREMANEYKAIHDGGSLLQIDAPDLAMARVINFQDKSDTEFQKICEMQVDAINRGIAGIPRDRVRLHVCWGNWEGPHLFDISLSKVLAIFLKANVGALSIEFANPRHAHEYPTLGHVGFPKDMLLIPGVIETTSNFVEHPELVARRIEEAVATIGDRERVIASTDCGFGTFAGREWVIAPVVWKKLEALRQGADIASQRLWGKKVA
ncbi:MAG: cobalamin-independent methionine synthase II family protein [Pseudolabrys sp.]|nr:cobalamin-independent methionine synthase II family protein [Pseudolabrys sp.]